MLTLRANDANRARSRPGRWPGLLALFWLVPLLVGCSAHRTSPPDQPAGADGETGEVLLLESGPVVPDLQEGEGFDAASIGRDLAKNAGMQIAGAAFGHLMTQLGLPGTGTKLQEISKKLDEISKKLDKIRQEMEEKFNEATYDRLAIDAEGHIRAIKEANRSFQRIFTVSRADFENQESFEREQRSRAEGFANAYGVLEENPMEKAVYALSDIAVGDDLPGTVGLVEAAGNVFKSFDHVRFDDRPCCSWTLAGGTVDQRRLCKHRSEEGRCRDVFKETFYGDMDALLDVLDWYRVLGLGLLLEAWHYNPDAPGKCPKCDVAGKVARDVWGKIRQTRKMVGAPISDHRFVLQTNTGLLWSRAGTKNGEQTLIRDWEGVGALESASGEMNTRLWQCQLADTDCAGFRIPSEQELVSTFWGSFRGPHLFDLLIRGRQGAFEGGKKADLAVLPTQGKVNKASGGEGCYRVLMVERRAADGPIGWDWARNSHNNTIDACYCSDRKPRSKCGQWAIDDFPVGLVQFIPVKPVTEPAHCKGRWGQWTLCEKELDAWVDERWPPV